MRTIISAAALAIFLLAAGSVLAGPAPPLQLSISTENAVVTEPFPLRLILDFHNSSQYALWLYAPVRDALAISQSTLGPTPGGSALVTHLEAAGGSPLGIPAVGTLLRSVSMPRPKLIRVAPGNDYHQTLAIHVSPAAIGPSAGRKLVWGAYDVSVVYSASYSNGASINRDLRVRVWQGSLGSNRLPIQLRPAPAANVASVGGAVLSREMQPDWGILVSLSDWNERLIAQSVTGNDGGFSFSRLPYGRYWVTVRQPGADYETGFFEHADLSASHPDARLKLIMLNQEEYEANQMLHKPVLFRIVDGAGNPVNGAMLHILWSNGTVMETVRAVTGQDGLAETNLLPGSNYVTIEKRHCRKEDRMANAAAGIGIEGFSITYDCGK